MKNRVEELIDILQLQKHPEGGWYKEVFRSKGVIEGDAFPGGRNYITSIYFLLTSDNFSAFHKILSDEIWHFYEGDPLEVIEITEDGKLKSTIVGSSLADGNSYQYTVPAGSWFGSRVFENGSYSLVGCTVAPGFDFRDFVMADRTQLLNDFPKYHEIILALTRQ